MYILLINTRSGRRKNIRIYDKLKSTFDFEDIPFYMNSSDPDLWEQIKGTCAQYDQRIKGIIIIGGDGTIHTVINHLKELHIPFGLIPSGSGNDFARGLKIPNKPFAAMNIILNQNPQYLDLIQTGDEYTVSIASLGIDATTAIRAGESSIKQWLNRMYLGKFIYLLTFFQEVRTFSPLNVSLEDESGIIREYSNVWLAAFGNTSYYGGGIPICPEAVPNDGRLDVVIVHHVTLKKLMLFLPSVFIKTHTKISFVDSFRCNQLFIQSNQKAEWQGDGEALVSGESKFIRLIQKDISFFLPKR